MVRVLAFSEKVIFRKNLLEISNLHIFQSNAIVIIEIDSLLSEKIKKTEPIMFLWLP